MRLQSQDTDTRCTWMRAGVLTYKLCDHEFECDFCPLDMVLRKTEAPQQAPAQAYTEHPVDCPLPMHEDEEILKLLQPFSHCPVGSDLVYSPGHVWVRLFKTKLAVLGLDSFIAMRLPETFSLVLPARKTPIEKGAPLGWVYTKSKTIPIISPLSGSIIRQNPLACEETMVIRTAPYDLGWLLSIIPTRLDAELPDLLGASTAERMVRHDMNTYITRAASRLRAHVERAGICMNDGGAPVATLEEALGEAAFVDLLRSVLPGSSS
jgi:glycine cleavage system H protein